MNWDERCWWVVLRNSIKKLVSLSMFLRRSEPETYNYNTIMKASFAAVSAASAEHSMIIYSEGVFVSNWTQLCMNHSLQYTDESHQSDSFFKSKTSSPCALFFRQSLRHHQDSELKAAQQCLQFTSVTLSSQLSGFKICWSQTVKQQILLHLTLSKQRKQKRSLLRLSAAEN